jgi:tRNA (guanine-N1)-methyltransferase
MTVPEVLLSGNHEDIAAWRMAQRRRKTDERRKDMFEQS